ncbi:hypothetical protein chiPu_0024710, partial [Chiloscyllium punctatum]|nr:hypothetical protein [Chiloscyllium punctatum]
MRSPWLGARRSRWLGARRSPCPGPHGARRSPCLGFPFSVVPHDNLPDEETLLPKGLWDTRKVQSVTSRPRSCEVPGITKAQPLFAAHPLEDMEESMSWAPPAQHKDEL